MFAPWEKIITEKLDIIVSNPPYWNTENLKLNEKIIRDNPINAFIGGETGLEFYGEIIKKAPDFLCKNGKIFLEMEPYQKSDIVKMLNVNFENIEIKKDYLGAERVIFATKK